MNKRGTLLFALIASINLVSAISIGEALDMIGGENIILIGVFLISFFLLNMILGRFETFKDPVTKRTTAVPMVISFIISLFIIYGIYKYNFNVSNILDSIGITGDVLYIVILIGIIYLLYKLKGTLKWIWENKCLIFLFAGIICIWLSMTDIVYNQETLSIIGVILIIIWFLCNRYKKKKEKPVVPPTPGVTKEDKEDQKKREDAYKKQPTKKVAIRLPTELAAINKLSPASFMAEILHGKKKIFENGIAGWQKMLQARRDLEAYKNANNQNLFNQLDTLINTANGSVRSFIENYERHKNFAIKIAEKYGFAQLETGEEIDNHLDDMRKAGRGREVDSIKKYFSKINEVWNNFSEYAKRIFKGVRAIVNS